jgi:hypothetical protein
MISNFSRAHLQIARAIAAFIMVISAGFGAAIFLNDHARLGWSLASKDYGTWRTLFLGTGICFIGITVILRLDKR